MSPAPTERELLAEVDQTVDRLAELMKTLESYVEHKQETAPDTAYKEPSYDTKP